MAMGNTDIVVGDGEEVAELHCVETTVRSSKTKPLQGKIKVTEKSIKLGKSFFNN